jgi:hypothetical protein
MNKGKFLRKLATFTAFTAVILSGLLIVSHPGRAWDGKDDKNDNDFSDADKAKILIGFRVAPVPLNLVGKDRNMVGLGSYIVNVVSECNGCHSAGPVNPVLGNELLGNPYLFAPPSVTVHQTKKVNPATYLGGGRDFGPYPNPNSPLHIYSRNLTPDNTGKPEGGHSYSEFAMIMRTGKDFDPAVHPTCPGSTQTASCVPYPFDGGLLQVMPWSAYQDITETELRAIYAYLSAVPCIDTVVPGQDQLRNTCPHK